MIFIFYLCDINKTYHRHRLSRISEINLAITVLQKYGGQCVGGTSTCSYMTPKTLFLKQSTQKLSGCAHYCCLAAKSLASLPAFLHSYITTPYFLLHCNYKFYIKQSMDVTGHTFQTQLFSILGAISRSHFVSFDLELTGIPGKQFKSKTTAQSEDGRQTLQQRYEETKAAASRYQILQLGLTCVEEDKKRGTPQEQAGNSRWSK